MASPAKKRFLRGLEGFETKPYIGPKTYDANGKEKTWKSGLTFANGVDIGQMSQREFNALPLRPATKDRLRPFVGKRGYDAEALLKANPIGYLSEEEMSNVEDYSLTKQEGEIRAKMGAKWDAMPDEAQAVYLSLNHNFGSSGAPATKKMLEDQRYDEAMRELRDSNQWSDQNLMPRRNKEADMLGSIQSLGQAIPASYTP